MNSCWKFLTITLLLCSFATQAYPGLNKDGEPKSQSRVHLVQVLSEPYPLKAVTFKDIDGKSMDFSDYKGKFIMVNMWATWCPPCVREIPAIEKLAQKFDAKEFGVVPISIDQDGKEQVLPFLKSMGMESFQTFYDKEQMLGQVFPLDTIPATFILNKQGELIAYVRTFVDWSHDEAAALIKELIKKG